MITVEERPDPFLTQAQRARGNKKGAGRQTCKLPECDDKHYARGWCLRHFMRWWRTGTPRGAEHLRLKRLAAVPLHEEHKGPHVPWTTAEKATVVSLRAKGYTHQMIARALGRSKNAVAAMWWRHKRTWQDD